VTDQLPCGCTPELPCLQHAAPAAARAVLRAADRVVPDDVPGLDALLDRLRNARRAGTQADDPP